MPEIDTRSQLLQVALEIIQTRGYNALSFRIIADRVGIKTASIHYHFPTKGDLGVALVQQHRRLLSETLSLLECDEPDVCSRLRRYTEVFRETLANGHRMCLGGILAVEYQTLPPLLVAEVEGFFKDNEEWLARTLQSGRKSGALAFDGPPSKVARTLFAALEGVLLSARTFGDFDRFDSAVNWLLKQLAP